MGTVLEMDGCGWVWVWIGWVVWMVDGRVGVNEGLAVLRTDCTVLLHYYYQTRIEWWVRVRVRVRARERGRGSFRHSRLNCFSPPQAVSRTQLLVRYST